MAQLPEDLIVEILLRLPVRSVLRFKCLSKPLCAVIDSLDFINSHLCKSSQNFNLRKLIFSGRSEFHVFDVNLDLEEEILHLENPVSSPWGVVCDNCNGLLLLDHNFGLTLWNPSTRQRRDLPDCPFEQPAFIIWSGLGYDDSVDDYKAFIMVRVERELEDEVHVWTYGLKSNIWRRIHNFPYLVYENFFPGMSTFADGSLHWISTPMIVSNGKRNEIVALDVGKETFSLVSQPID